MRDELVERVLAGVMGWGAAEVAERGGQLQSFAALKYDEYEGYRPGEAFLEHLAAWLSQMTPQDRERAAEFVLRELVFVSRAEMDHLIETVYPDVIRPLLVGRASEMTGIPSWQVQRLTETQEFKSIHRKTLVLGLADGARIDRLRRSSGLSHEQFYVAPELSTKSVERMQKKLQEAVGGEEAALFEHVVLVDDFAGSGFTSIRRDGDEWDGRLPRTRAHLSELAAAGSAVIQDPTVTVVLYVASAQARDWISTKLEEQGLGWSLHVMQELPESLRVVDPHLLRMCQDYFDPANYEILGEHVTKMEGDVRLGFGDGRLPVVLSHNTPNNSISLLWADTTGRPEALPQRALFPRRHRHNAERP